MESQTNPPSLVTPGADLTKLQPVEGQVDLIGQCRQILVHFGIAPEQLEIFDNDPNLRVAAGLNTGTQRIALNSFWSLQMSPFGSLSHPQRFKLIENGSAEDWLRLFGSGPAQFIIDNKLPVRYE